MATPSYRIRRIARLCAALAVLPLAFAPSPASAQAPPATIGCATDTSSMIAGVTGDTLNGGFPNRLRFINAATGQSTIVTTTSVVPNHLAYNPDRQIFYYVNNVGVSLYGYDLNTGVHTLIDDDIRSLPGGGGAPTGFTGHDAGAYWNGRFYFIPHNGNNGQTGDDLHWIEFGPTGLTITNSGLLELDLPGSNSHMGDFGDIAIDANGILYGSSTDGGAGQIGGFFRADLNEAFPDVDVLSGYSAAQLAFSGDGTLYANPQGASQIDRINPANGQVLSSVALGFGGAFYDLSDISRPACDFGDLPDGPYPTSLASNGPSHKTEVLTNVRLGALVDSEPDGQSSLDALGDGADEDGVRFLNPVIPGRVVDIEVTASGAGRLNAWIDFDSDGTFSGTEKIASNVIVAAGANLLNNVPVPATATGVMAARFRITVGTGQGGFFPTGPALNGEVEDYMLGCVGNQVWNDLDGDGINEPLGNDGLPGGGDDEPGVPNVVVRLVRPVSPYAQIPDGNGVPISTTTNAGGFYQLCGLPPAASSGLPNPGTYRVLFDRPAAFTDFSPPNLGGNDLTDSDADQDPLGVGFEGLAPLPALPALTVAAAQIDDSVDAGLRAVTVALVTSAGAYLEDGAVVFEFSTGYEALTGGFEVLRWDSGHGGYVPVTSAPVAAPFAAPQGSVYRVVDDGAPAGGRLTYVVVEHQTDGRTQAYGPYGVAVRRQRADTPRTDGFAVEPHVSSRLAGRLADGRRERREATPLRKVDRLWAAENAPGSGGGQEWTLQLDVRDSGLYFVSAADMAASVGLSEARVRSLIDRGTVSVENLGQDVAWLPSQRSSDGLYFYGEAIDDLYTRDNPYRVRLEQSGQRMAVVKGGFPLASDNGTFRSVEHFERDLLPSINATFETGVDFWYWDGINAASSQRFRSFEASVADAVGGSATLTIHVVGATNGAAFLDHHATVRINGVEVGSTAWSGTERHSASMTFEGSLLTPATTIEVEGSLEGGATSSVFFIDGFDLEYERAYRAIDDRLLVNGSGNAVVTVDGFSSADVLVFDLTEPSEPRLAHSVRVELGADGFRASFQPDGSTTPYLVTTATAARSDLDLRRVSPPIDLRATHHAYDHVVIAPAAWRQAAQGLAAHRSSAGTSSLAVDVEDVYDAFGDGLATPWAIRDFLAYARQHWSQGPTHVVLAGRGTFDSRDLLGGGDSFLPTVMVGTPYGLLGSDNALADLELDDSIPEVAIGRLPVVSAAELDAYVAKLAAYGGASGEWRDRALLLADNADAAGNFPGQSDDVGAIWGGYAQQRIYLSQMTPTAARAALTAAWSEGAQLVNYVGHGGVTQLAAEGILRTSDVSGLTNGDRLPIFSALTCVVGRSDIPNVESLAEALVTATDGGAIAVFAPVGVSLSGAAHELNLLYAAALAAAEPGAPLGSAVLDALRAFGAGGAAHEMLAAYGITGDPAVRLP